MKVLSLFVFFILLSSCKTSTGSGLSAEGSLTGACDIAAQACKAGRSAQCIKDVAERKVTVGGLRTIKELEGASAIVEGGMMRDPVNPNTGGFASEASVSVTAERIASTDPNSTKLKLNEANAAWAGSLEGTDKTAYADALVEASQKARGSDFGGETESSAGRALSLAEAAEGLRAAGDVNAALEVGGEAAASLADVYRVKSSFDPAPVIKTLNDLVVSGATPELTARIGLQLGRSVVLAKANGSSQTPALDAALSGLVKGDRAALEILQADGAAIENVSAAIAAVTNKSTKAATVIKSPIPETLIGSRELNALKDSASKNPKGIETLNFGELAVKQKAATEAAVARIQKSEARTFIEAGRTEFNRTIKTEVKVRTRALAI